MAALHETASVPVVPVWRILAGAAKGAWMAILVSFVLVTVSWFACLGLTRFAPDLLPALLRIPQEDIWPLLMGWIVSMKMIMYVWLLFAIFLSTWWRALRPVVYER